jgi:hypothetical protein
MTASRVAAFPQGPLGDQELRLLDAYWRAANYLAVGQIYLLTNPLLREPLTAEQIKPRLFGHFGAVPGLDLVYAHMNRAIRARSSSCCANEESLPTCLNTPSTSNPASKASPVDRATCSSSNRTPRPATPTPRLHSMSFCIGSQPPLLR